MAYDIGVLDGGDGAGPRRLLALADYLETIDPKHYDHRTWRRRLSDGSWAMCALGHAASGLPDVVGLRWRAPDSADIVRIDGSGFMADALALAGEAFELTDEEARMIFGVGLHTVDFYGAAAVFGAKPKSIAATIRTFALARIGYPLGMVAA